MLTYDQKPTLQTPEISNVQARGFEEEHTLV